MPAPLEGGCFCGAIRYRISGTPGSIGICHCQSCRRASGAPSVSWFTIPSAQFTRLTGTPQNHRSSAHVVRTFCGACGTQLTYAHDSSPESLDVTTASLDHPEAVEPTKEIWLVDKLPWVALNENLDHHRQESAPGAVTTDRSATQSKFTPSGWTTVTPRIIAVDAKSLVEFVKTVFGAMGDYHPQAPAELKLGDSRIMISDAGVRAPAPACLYVYVPNADVTWQRAIDAGAKSVEKPTNTPYGDRRGIVIDRWGNTWQIATRLPAAGD
jgi:uncharacterized glyoxalase superfamily protein PhnB